MNSASRMPYLSTEHLGHYSWILPSRKGHFLVLLQDECFRMQLVMHLKRNRTILWKAPSVAPGNNSLSPNNNPYLLYPTHSFLSKITYKVLKAPSWTCIIFSPEWKADWSSGPTDMGALEPAAKGVWSWCWTWSAPLDSGILTLLPISDVDLCIKKEKKIRNFCHSDLQMRFVATQTLVTYSKTNQWGASWPTLLWHDRSLGNNWTTEEIWRSLEKFGNKPFSLAAILPKHVITIV